MVNPIPCLPPPSLLIAVASSLQSSAFPVDVPFREKFLDIISRFPTSVSSHVEGFVLQSLEQDFEGQKGKEEEAWKVRTEWPIKKLKRTLGERGKKSRKRGRSKTIGEEEEEMEEVKRLRMALEETERDCQQLLQAAVEQLSSEAIWEFYLLWVESRIAEAIGEDRAKIFLPSSLLDRKPLTSLCLF